MSSHPLAFMRLPFDLLAALDSRMFHFWMQPVHYLVRLLHILSMSAFFGIVLLIDLRLMRKRDLFRLRPVIELALPWIHTSFAVAFVTGLLLFFYDPVHAGSRAFMSPKLLMIAVGLINTAIAHKTGYIPAMMGNAPVTRRVRISATISVFAWTLVIVFSCLNTESVPKVFLR